MHVRIYLAGVVDMVRVRNIAWDGCRVPAEWRTLKHCEGMAAQYRDYPSGFANASLSVVLGTSEDAGSAEPRDGLDLWWDDDVEHPNARNNNRVKSTLQSDADSAGESHDLHALLGALVESLEFARTTLKQEVGLRMKLERFSKTLHRSACRNALAVCSLKAEAAVARLFRCWANLCQGTTWQEAWHLHQGGTKPLPRRMAEGERRRRDNLCKQANRWRCRCQLRAVVAAWRKASPLLGKQALMRGKSFDACRSATLHMVAKVALSVQQERLGKILHAWQGRTCGKRLSRIARRRVATLAARSLQRMHFALYRLADAWRLLNVLRAWWDFTFECA